LARSWVFRYSSRPAVAPQLAIEVRTATRAHVRVRCGVEEGIQLSFLTAGDARAAREAIFRTRRDYRHRPGGLGRPRPRIRMASRPRRTELDAPSHRPSRYPRRTTDWRAGGHPAFEP